MTQMTHPTTDRWPTIKFVLWAIVGMVLLNLPAGIYRLGWKSATFTTSLVLIVFLSYAFIKKDRWLLGWTIFGLVAGIVELAADVWLVESTKSLVYAPNEPFIFASPLYMPGAWALVLMQLGILGHWLRTKLPLWAAILVTSTICGLNIPIYEALAKAADWWIYQDTPMIVGAPYYIILGEAFLGPGLIWFGVLLDRQPMRWAVPLGILQGIFIFIAYGIAWWLLGPCDGAILQLPCSGG